MAVSKDFLWDTLASVVAELERVDPQSVVAARVQGFLDVRRMSLHTTDRHVERQRRHYRSHDDEIVRLYLEGSSSYAISQKLNINPSTVAGALRRKGVATRTSGVAKKVATQRQDETRLELIKNRRAEGKNLEEIGTELGITRERVRQICVRNGISTEWILTPTQKQAVADYVSGKSLELVAGLNHVNPATLRGWVVKEGFAIRPSPKKGRRDPESLKKAEQAEALYRQGRTITEISRALGYGTAGAPVYRLLAWRGIDPVKRQKEAA